MDPNSTREGRGGGDCDGPQGPQQEGDDGGHQDTHLEDRELLHTMTQQEVDDGDEEVRQAHHQEGRELHHTQQEVDDGDEEVHQAHHQEGRELPQTMTLTQQEVDDDDDDDEGVRQVPLLEGRVLHHTKYQQEVDDEGVDQVPLTEDRELHHTLTQTQDDDDEGGDGEEGGQDHAHEDERDQEEHEEGLREETDEGRKGEKEKKMEMDKEESLEEEEVESKEDSVILEDQTELIEGVKMKIIPSDSPLISPPKINLAGDRLEQHTNIEADNRQHTPSKPPHLDSRKILKLRPPPSPMVKRRIQRKKKVKVTKLPPSEGIRRYLVPTIVPPEVRDEPEPIEASIN